MKLYAKNSAGTVTLLASNAGASGSVTSVSGTGTVNGLTLTGTVTTSGSLTLGGTLSLVSPPPIGSTTPNTGAFSSLTVNGGLLFNANGDSSSATGEIKQLTGSGLTIYSKTGSSYDFTLLNAGGSNLMRVPTGTSNLEITQTNATFTSTGLGIGTSSPASKLDVRSSASSGVYGAIIINSSATGQGLTVRGGSTSSQDAFNVQTYDGGLSLFAVRGDGNVGIGTSSPATKVQVSAAGPTFRLEETTTGGSKRLDMGVTSGGQAFIGANQSAQSIQIQTQGSTRFEIGASGQFGIGGATYGTAGEVLTSGGSGAAHTWEEAGGGSQAFVAFGSTGGL
jgi:hypothetical protein